MSLKSIKNTINAWRSRITDSFNNDVIMQGSTGEEINIANDYIDDEGFGIFVGTGGILKVDFLNGGTVSFKNLNDASYVIGRFSKIYSTVNGTTATDIIVYK